jgi:hypothetical protein
MSITNKPWFPWFWLNESTRPGDRCSTRNVRPAGVVEHEFPESSWSLWRDIHRETLEALTPSLCRAIQVTVLFSALVLAGRGQSCAEYLFSESGGKKFPLSSVPLRDIIATRAEWSASAGWPSMSALPRFVHRVVTCTCLWRLDGKTEWLYTWSD